MEAKVRDEILDRVMRVLVEEKGGQMVLSKRVENIMLSKTKQGGPKYPNVIRTVEESGSHSQEDLSSEEEDAPSPALHPKTTQKIFPGFFLYANNYVAILLHRAQRVHEGQINHHLLQFDHKCETEIE